MPQQIRATLCRQRPAAQTDDWAHVILDYGRRKVILHCSLLATSDSPRFMVHGMNASMIKRLPDQRDPSCWLD
jgi:hypothetical protein